MFRVDKVAVRMVVFNDFTREEQELSFEFTPASQDDPLVVAALAHNSKLSGEGFAKLASSGTGDLFQM